MPEDTPTADVEVQLQSERAELVEKLTELGHGDGSNGLSYDSNFADSSQVTAERSEVETLVASLRETLEDVERALAKIDEGTYGLCEVCGEPISEARLEAMPAARTCINCASRSS